MSKITRQEGVAIATACKLEGFTHRFEPASYEDVGGPESGPDVVGHENTEIYSKQLSNGATWLIILEHDGDDFKLHVQVDPPGPPDSEG